MVMVVVVRTAATVAAAAGLFAARTPPDKNHRHSQYDYQREKLLPSHVGNITGKPVHATEIFWREIIAVDIRRPEKFGMKNENCELATTGWKSANCARQGRGRVRPRPHTEGRRP